MKFAKTHFLLLIAVGIFQQLIAQPLPRRAFFGVRMEAVTDETARIMNLPAVKGVLVSSVVPGSTAEAAGLQRSDVWLTLNDREINSPNEGVAALRQLREGDKFRYKYLRQGKEYDKEALLKPFPKENYADFDLEYGAVQSGKGLKSAARATGYKDASALSRALGRARSQGGRVATTGAALHTGL